MKADFHIQYNYRNHLAKFERYTTDGQEMHWHDIYEFEFIASGKGIHRLNSKEYPLERGSMYVTRLRDYHEMEVEETVTVHRISLPAQLMPEKYVVSMLKNKANIITTLPEELCNRIETLFLLLEDEPEAETDEQKYLLQCIINVIIMLFTRQVNTAPGDLHKPDNVKAFEVMLYLRDHIRQRHTLKSVAEEFKMNPHYLNRILKQHMNITVFAALKIFRLQYAAQLAVETDLSVKEICKNIGYTDSNNFIRDFRMRYGVPPAQYRKQERERLANGGEPREDDSLI